MPKVKKKSSPSSKKKKIIKTSFLKNPLFSKIIAVILIIFSLLILTWKFPVPKPTNKNPIVINSKLLESKNTQNIPIRIIIPKNNIDLKVTPSEIVNGYWETSEVSASYGLGSGYPQSKSNTVIFAHAREGLFYNLKDVKIGETIYVFSKDKWFRYKVNKIKTVLPNQIEVISPTKNEILTLYTCSGFYDEKRLIVTAVPLN